MSFHWRWDARRRVTPVTVSGMFAGDPRADLAALELAAGSRWRRSPVLIDLRELDSRTVPTYEVLWQRVTGFARWQGVQRRAAILTGPGAAYGIGRMIAALLGEGDDTRISVFTEEDEAIVWLHRGKTLG